MSDTMTNRNMRMKEKSHKNKNFSLNEILYT